MSDQGTRADSASAGFNKVTTPMEPGLRLEKHEGKPHSVSDEWSYRSVIGSVMFMVNQLRPDVSFAVQLRSTAPGEVYILPRARTPPCTGQGDEIPQPHTQQEADTLGSRTQIQQSREVSS